MRVLVIYAHPVESSYSAGLHAAVLRALKVHHQVQDLDLYAEDFDPRLSRHERLHYHDVTSNTAQIEKYVAQLRWAEAVVFCFPVWCFGPPAILKGYFDRVLVPGVAFDIDGAKVTPKLTYIRKIAAIITYGRSRWAVRFSIGDMPRTQITRYFRWFCGRRTPVEYHAHYNMNAATNESRAQFLARVEKAFGSF